MPLFTNSCAEPENYLRNLALAEASAEIWRSAGEQGGLVSELWIQGAFPSNPSNDSLESLAREGLFPKDLCEYLDATGKFPAKRALFAHQSAAFRHVVDFQPGKRPSLVITAGTGAGKTEAFLLPILSGLWKETRGNERGMRCLILYPMNALVTDQVTRLYELLKDQNKLSLFHFTSETPETDRNATPAEKWNPCRPWSRETARANIPDIVITNYSMLEYMLCRPQDQEFFGPGLRYVVVDEAHLYTGTLAAEITLLLRRVRDRCRVSPEQITHIATSATLGGTTGDLETFAATVFSVPRTLVKVFEGTKAPLPASLAIKSAQTPNPGQLEQYSGIEVVTLNADGAFMSADPEALSRLRPMLATLLPSSVIAPAEVSANQVLAPFLRFTMEQIPVVRRLMELIHENDLLSIGDLARKLWGDDTRTTNEATILLLRLTAAARSRPNDSPLIPHRLHFLVRAPQGLSACLTHHALARLI